MPLDLKSPEVERAVFGKVVENFLDSEIGQYLIKKIKEEQANATKDLADRLREGGLVDPKFITAIQDRMRVAELVKSWLGAAVEEGYAALDQIMEDA